MAEQRTVNPLVVGSSPTSPAMIKFIKQILFPGFFDPDFRPFIILITVMIFSITYVIKKNWDNIKYDIDSQWE